MNERQLSQPEGGYLLDNDDCLKMIANPTSLPTIYQMNTLRMNL